MLNNILFALFFFLPAGVANTTPVIIAKLPVLKNFNYPLDFYKSFKGTRVFGDHKTIRGLVAGILAGTVSVYIETAIYNNSSLIQKASPINYTTMEPLLLGFLLSFGALAGDFMKSFFKRRANIMPGKTWIPFDQIDYILGGILFSYVYIQLDFVHYLYILVIWATLHPISTIFAYFVKLKDTPI